MAAPTAEASDDAVLTEFERKLEQIDDEAGGAEWWKKYQAPSSKVGA